MKSKHNTQRVHSAMSNAKIMHKPHMNNKLFLHIHPILAAYTENANILSFEFIWLHNTYIFRTAAWWKKNIYAHTRACVWWIPWSMATNTRIYKLKAIKSMGLLRYLIRQPRLRSALRSIHVFQLFFFLLWSRSRKKNNHRKLNN